jgi:guanylate kinase
LNKKFSEKKFLRKGSLFILSAPSGAGKSSICKKLIAEDDLLRFSVSCTSRPPRDCETDGKDYHFLSKEEFRKKIDAGDFLEWAEYAENYYGTDRVKTLEALESGLDVLLDIEVQGADQIKAIYPEVVRIFVLPPSMEILRDRLIKRGTNTEEDLKKRLITARNEVRKVIEFDYAVVNDDLDRATYECQEIIDAARRRSANNREMIISILRSFE